MRFLRIVTLQKITKLFLVLFAICPVALFSQQKDCNKETKLKSDNRFIPKEVCIQNGYIISYIFSRYERIDFNKDSLNDFVMAVKTKKRNVGDTSFLVFYKMNKDSTFSFYKQFNNIYPIYFEPDNETPNLINQSLQDLFSCYMIPTPLNYLEIKNDSIFITRNMDAQNIERIKYTYKFEPKINDWVLIKKVKSNQFQLFPMAIKRQELLSNFSYCNQ